MFFVKRKSVYLMLALSVVIIAPVIVLVTPVVISSILFDHPNKIVFLSYGKSFIMYGLAFAIAFFALLILYLLKSIIVKLFVFFLTISSFIFFYSMGINYYVYLDEYYIEYNPLFGKTSTYEWYELSKVTHVVNSRLEDEKYMFEFQDGFSFEFFPTDTMNASIKKKLYDKIMQLDVSYEEY